MQEDKNLQRKGEISYGEQHKYDVEITQQYAERNCQNKETGADCHAGSRFSGVDAF